MNKRPINKSKKSNIKCENCRYWSGYIDNIAKCCLNDEKKNYWNRCKAFEWAESEDKE